jgi:hypothetical protein
MRVSVVIAAVLALGAFSGGAERDQQARAANWREIAWPFPRDGWPAGRAFRCDAASCGAAIEIYVRPKLGFCNCDTGVADDDEVDRVADLDLISARFGPEAAGQPAVIAGLRGRIRRYGLELPDGSRRAAVGVALSRHCDLLVAAAQGTGAPAQIERAALMFLQGQNTSHWMIAALQAH